MNSTEIHTRLNDLSPKLRDLSQRRNDQTAKVNELEKSLIHGPNESLPSERSALESLTVAYDSARNEESGLIAAYERAILSETSQSILDCLKAAAAESGSLFDDYISLRKEHGIYGKTKDELARHLLRELHLNYVSGHAIRLFNQRYGVPQI